LQLQFSNSNFQYFIITIGIAGQLGKKKSQAKADALKLGLTEQSKDIADLLDGLSSDR
jgi:hypothetical protein